MSEKENIEDAHKVFDKLQHPLLQIESLSLTFHGHDLIVDSELELNFGRRYGLLGLNGCGKSTLLSAIGCCELPIPERMDIFHLTREIEASDLAALEALVSCDVERLKLEKEVEALAGQGMHVSCLTESVNPPFVNPHLRESIGLSQHRWFGCIHIGSSTCLRA